MIRNTATKGILHTETWLRNVLRPLSDAAICTDSQYRIILLNPAAESMFHYDEKDVIGIDLKTLIPRGFPPASDPCNEKKGEQKTSDSAAGPSVLLYGRRKDGKKLPLEAFVSPYNVHDQTYYTIILRDVTAKKAAQLEKKLYEHTLESIHESIALLDPGGKILFVNNAFTQRFGYDKIDVVGNDVQTLLSEKNPGSIVQDIYEKALEDGWDGKLFITKQDGTELPVYITTSVLKDESGKPKGLICVSQDISRQKFLEEQFIQIKKMEGISVLVEGIAHNFNNILAIIMGYASLSLSEDVTREKIDRNLNIIIEATERGAKLIKQLFTLRRPHTIQLEPVDLNKLILDTLHIASETFTRTYKFTTHLDHALPKLMADQSSMQQAILNVLLNARDAMPGGGMITISTEVIYEDTFLKNGFTRAKHDTFIRISVKDTGVGMDADTKNQIFDPFFTTKDVDKGIGLGMTIVYGTVKNHHGFIDIESAVGKGTTVHLYLPVETEEPSDMPGS